MLDSEVKKLLTTVEGPGGLVTKNVWAAVTQSARTIKTKTRKCGFF